MALQTNQLLIFISKQGLCSLQHDVSQPLLYLSEEKRAMTNSNVQRQSQAI
jgi:hypothetical protein